MPQVKVFFVRGDITSVVDDTIAIFSKGPYVHVAMEICGKTLESLGCIVQDENGQDIPPGVRFSPLGKYDNRDDVLTKLVDVPDQAAAEAMALRLIGTPYGYIDCIEGGLHDQAGVHMADDGLLTANCSKTVTLVVRAGGNDILPGTPAGDITPMDLVREI